jgi:acyl carrier protein
MNSTIRVLLAVFCGATVLCVCGCSRNMDRQTAAPKAKKASAPTVQTESKAATGTRDKIIRIVAELLETKPEQIDPDKPLSHPSIGADELDVAEIVMELEDAFDIELTDEAITDSKTGNAEPSVNKLAETVDSILLKKSQSKTP